MAGVLESSLFFLGKSVMLKGISDTTSTIYNILQSSMINSHPDVKTTFETLDLEARLQVIQAIITNTHSEKEPIKIALTNLHEILNSIKKEIEVLQEKMTMNEEKYFSSWRTPDYLPLLDNIEKHSQTLNTRLDLLLNVVKINNSFTVIPEN